MAHCAFIRRFVSIWRRSLPLQGPDIPHRKHQNPSEGVEDAIDREFNDLLDQWRKLTSEILSEPTERYEMANQYYSGKRFHTLLRSIRSNEYIRETKHQIGLLIRAEYKEYEIVTTRPFTRPDHDA